MSLMMFMYNTNFNWPEVYDIIPIINAIVCVGKHSFEAHIIVLHQDQRLINSEMLEICLLHCIGL